MEYQRWTERKWENRWANTAREFYFQLWWKAHSETQRNINHTSSHLLRVWKFISEELQPSMCWKDRHITILLRFSASLTLMGWWFCTYASLIRSFIPSKCTEPWLDTCIVSGTGRSHRECPSHYCPSAWQGWREGTAGQHSMCFDGWLGDAMGELERAGKWHHQQPRGSGMASWRKWRLIWDSKI